jgi:Tol biopolymer transport system component/sugar phosphate isomerase/epimerase
MSMRFGVNLFGAYSTYKKDPEKFFQAVAEAGYRYVEPCVRIDEKLPEIPGFWNLSEVEQYAKAYKASGLSVYTCHVATTEPEKAAEALRSLQADYGYENFVIVYGCEITKESYTDFAHRLCALSDELKGSGIRILIHNNGETITTRIDGISAYEWLLHACEGKVLAEPDTGWLLYGGEDPEAFLWRNQKSIAALHYKDMKKNEDGTLSETPVGTGLVDMEGCFQFARAVEIPQFVDQDSSDDLILDIKNVGEKFGGLTQCRSNTKSILCVYDCESRTVEKLTEFDRIIEAPNWHKDGDSIFYNSDGLIYRYQISTGEEQVVPTGICCNCNNDHVLSPDHSQIAVSHSDPGGWESKIYILPIEGGTPRLVTPNAPSFLHGWSPDGTELAYCAFRMEEDQMVVDVYSISSEGGEEKQLTSHAGFNDGPEYDPDGEHIWINSTRTGLMQIFRMKRDGSEQTQMTFEDRNNWFAHVSPDGQKVVNLSYSKEGLDAKEHLPNMDVELWMMSPDGSNREKILEFFGGQGSINVNSWSPDSRKFAFVMYELEHK